MSRYFEVATYPTVIAITVIGFITGVSLGLPIAVATYLSVSISAVIIIVLETMYPHRAEWQMDRRSAVNDAKFLVIVQMLLPTLISAIVVFGLSALSENGDFAFAVYYPWC